MGNSAEVPPLSPDRFAVGQARVIESRERARHLFERGATGVQVAAAISQANDAIVVELFERALCELNAEQRAVVDKHCALIAVGGSGRGALAPFSDTDLLFLYAAPAASLFEQRASQVVRDCWDAGLRLGHTICTPAQALALSGREIQSATALVEARLLAGNGKLFRRFVRRFQSRVCGRGMRHFITECLAARENERRQHGSTVTPLEPDVKRSLGGLRDLHLIRWVGFARFGTTDIETLRLKGGLSKEDARSLVAAEEFIMQIRNDLHFAAGRSNDVLNREEQLRIAEQRQIPGDAAQRPVERLMQAYFQQSATIADVADRFIARYRPRTMRSRMLDALLSHRADGIYTVGHDSINVRPRYRQYVCADLDRILQTYRLSILYGLPLSPELVEAIRRAAPTLSPELTPRSIQLFLDILRCSGPLGRTLRSLYRTGILEKLVPQVARTRGLLQFNQYHSYTVDEHTLRAVEAAESFEREDGAVGTAYRAIPHKDILHLALLLHDLGKGFEEDHSEVGRRIAEQVAARLELPGHERNLLTFLVHKHLMMAHLAFRRDFSDPDTLVLFSHDVGSPETLRMLYVLTAADLKAVGPGVWNDWKAELLTELYDRAMLVLSGKHYKYLEAERFLQIKSQVKELFAPKQAAAITGGMNEWVDEQLNALSPNYWSVTPPERIVSDLKSLHELAPGGLFVEGEYEPETRTVEFRIIAHKDLADGCFHKSTGVLTAKRLEILSAQISTSLNGDVIDSYRVIDGDFEGAIPPSRIEEVAAAIRSVLLGSVQAEELFQRNRRFDSRTTKTSVSNLPMRVTIDNDSSDRCTIIDVFAHDRPGLLYTITRTLYDMGLSVELAKISTHLDQVVDVFYVTDADGAKIRDRDRLENIRAGLAERISHFENHGLKPLMSSR